MSELMPRSAKSGTHSDLDSYNISIVETSPVQFFESSADPDPALDNLDPAILTWSNAVEPNLAEVTARYLGQLDLATHVSPESAIDDFALATLELLRYDGRHITLSTCYNIPLNICGTIVDAQAAVCLIYRPSTTILLVLVDEKTLLDKAGNAETLVVRQAIATFQFNNERRKERGQPVLENMTIPCISMFGTVPTFYLVPVTRELSEAVMTAQYPTSRTVVQKCRTVAAHQMQPGNGMADIEFRKLAFKRFIAFKSLARSCWEKFLV
ncbi:hypothetical protein D9613_006338 [Agrocybe pediades]|uniref:Uncharacterized protein n=1 Tax=Agrocybe pediades TaxID=84607 RepID=A0A8H4VRM1_9AGAR|nr:hypothetical protein D9613_006338 [Agrocybe pediades]KAF9565081.1 hypothetical protein CPC08DRAFT_704895 [Agrocybe pediades]